MDVKSAIISSLKKALEELGITGVEAQVEVPTDDVHGDYSTNIALGIFSKFQITNSKSQINHKFQISKFKSPLELAEKIKEKLEISSEKLGVERIEAVAPGFINFWLSKQYLLDHLREIVGKSSLLASQGEALQGRKIMVEFAHPNTHKSFHIGHLRNISIGESVVRLLEAAGADIIRANYQGDVGMHIAKAIYGLLQSSKFKVQSSKLENESLNGKIKLLGEAYTEGSKAYEKDEEAKKAIKDINYLVYASAQKFQEEKGVKPSSTDYMNFVEGRKGEVDKVYQLWKETRQWSLSYFETIYKRVYTHYDRYYFESECLAGVDLAKEAVKRGILQEHEGAIIFNGKKYGLDTRVFVNSLGLPTYEAKELALAEKEFSEFGNLNRVIHVVGPEQASFFKVTFKVEELLGMQKNQQYHLVYGWVRLKEGKMSSRTGNVVLGEWLLDTAAARIKKEFSEMDEETAEKVAVAAVKYSMLKFATASDISFSFDESISLEGNSGPYIQYTYARTRSVVRKSQISNLKSQINTNWKMEIEEALLLRSLHRFPEIIEEAARGFAPNLLCNYLFDLAQKFNLFYQKHQIIPNVILREQSDRRISTGSFAESDSAQDDSTSQFRLFLTKAVGQVLKDGLYLLGIAAPDRM